MRVMITGAAGFAGRLVLREFAARGWTPAAYDLHAAAAKGGPDCRPLDIRDAEAVRAAVREAAPDAVLHLAALSFVPVGWSHPALTFSVNTLGVVHLLEAVRAEAPSARTLVVTSSEVYGWSSTSETITEDAPLKPETLYGVSKAAADTAARIYASRYNLPVMVARPCNHIGPGQNEEFVVPGFARQVARLAASRGEGAVKVGNLESRRDFVDAHDVARAYALILEKGRPGRAYNIGSGRDYAIGDVLHTLFRIAGIEPKIETDPARFRPADRRPLMDIGRARTELGWVPERTLEQSLRDVLAACS
jgi:GDP-4-dehydro-6-deoxy-D-mannose reductase